MPQPEEEADAPDWQVDLHGHSVAAALRRLRSALQDCRYQRYTSLRVITGRGRRSPGGAGKLTEVLLAWLNDGDARSLGVRHVQLGSKGGSIDISLQGPPPEPKRT